MEMTGKEGVGFVVDIQSSRAGNVEQRARPQYTAHIYTLLGQREIDRRTE